MGKCMDCKHFRQDSTTQLPHLGMCRHPDGHMDLMPVRTEFAWCTEFVTRARWYRLKNPVTIEIKQNDTSVAHLHLGQRTMPMWSEDVEKFFEEVEG